MAAELFMVVYANSVKNFAHYAVYKAQKKIKDFWQLSIKQHLC